MTESSDIQAFDELYESDLPYCESCGNENLSIEERIELYDGTIVCSEECKKEWEENCKENEREANDLPMKSFKVLVNIRAFNEEDMREQLASLDCYDVEWFCDCGVDK